MTGYGQAHLEDDCLRVCVEVKSINSKYADISLKLPKAFAAQEIAWRNLMLAHLGRGKIALTLTYERKNEGVPTTQINEVLFRVYYDRLQGLAKAVGASDQGLFQLALHAPEVMTKAENDTGQEEELQVLESVIKDALRQCDESRQGEGAVLAIKLRDYLKTIQQGLERIATLDPQRQKAIREKLETGIKTLTAKHTVDEGRLEQELLYYAERLDITEEKVRLAQHLAYFEEVMQHDQAEGKKLGFIAQEIGREINTIGAKANDAAIQKEVILMKDELEKIKEQLQNIL